MLISGKELPAAMRVSRATVRNWIRAGYVFEFGEMTTRGHCKAWLQEQAREGRANWLMKRAAS